MRRLKLTTSREQDAQRLDHILARWLPQALGREVSNAKIRKLIAAGVVYVNGRCVRIAAKPLPKGATIEAAIDVARLFHDATSSDQAFELTPARILFEDEDLIVIDKPARLPVHPTADEGRDNLVKAVQRFLSKRDGIEKPYLGIHQRLDRDTSGIVLFTKSERVNAGIADVFSKREAVKIYHAITMPPRSGSGGRMRKEWTVRNRLGKIASRTKRVRYGAVQLGGEPAETSFRVIAGYARGIHLRAMPKTGRTHQIRIHLSESGLPILGDDLYGPPLSAQSRGPASRLMLHAAELIFLHPLSQRQLHLQSPLPPDFQQCLTEIQS